MGDHIEVYQLMDHTRLLPQAHTEQEEEQQVRQSALRLRQAARAAQGGAGQLADLPGREEDDGLEAGLAGGVDVEHEVELEQGDEVGGAGTGEHELHPQQLAEAGREGEEREGVQPAEVTRQGQKDQHLVVVVGVVEPLAHPPEGHGQQLHDGHGGGDDHVLEEVEPAEQPEEEELVDHEAGVVAGVGVGAEHVGGEEGEDDQVAYCIPVVDEPLGIGVVVLQLDVTVALLPLHQLFQVLVQLRTDHRPPALAALDHHRLLPHQQPLLAVRAHLEGVVVRRPHQGNQNSHWQFPHEEDLCGPLDVGDEGAVIPPSLVITEGDGLHPLPEQLELPL